MKQEHEEEVKTVDGMKSKGQLPNFFFDTAAHYMTRLGTGQE